MGTRHTQSCTCLAQDHSQPLTKPPHGTLSLPINCVRAELMAHEGKPISYNQAHPCYIKALMSLRNGTSLRTGSFQFFLFRRFYAAQPHGRLSKRQVVHVLHKGQHTLSQALWQSHEESSVPDSSPCWRSHDYCWGNCLKYGRCIHNVHSGISCFHSGFFFFYCCCDRVLTSEKMLKRYRGKAVVLLSLSLILTILSCFCVTTPEKVRGRRWPDGTGAAEPAIC